MEDAAGPAAITVGYQMPITAHGRRGRKRATRSTRAKVEIAATWAQTNVHRIHFNSEVVATAQQDAAEVISVAQDKATSEDSGDDEPVITLTRRTRERVLTQEQRHRKLMHLGPTGSKTPCHICGRSMPKDQVYFIYRTQSNKACMARII